jgi:hypothetical protein
VIRPRNAAPPAIAMLALLCAAPAGAQLGGAPRTDNPTPGTAQPAPPNLADRITLVGCVERTSEAAGRAEPGTPSESRYVLTSAVRRRAVPVGTGGSKLTLRRTRPTYRLSAIESQLSPFAGEKVEISGEVRPQPAAAGEDAPLLVVEFVQRLGEACR